MGADAVGGVLCSKGFRRMLIAQFCSLTGTAMSPIALAFGVLAMHGGNARTLSLIVAGYEVVQLAALLFGGVLADRLPRRHVMVAANVTAAASQGAVATLFLIGRPSLVTLLPLVAAGGAGGGLFQPASVAVIGDLVPAGSLRKANAYLNIAGQVAAMGGMLLAGVLVALFGPGWPLAIDALSYAVSAVMLASVATAGGKTAGTSRFWRDLRGGWSAFRARTWVWVVVCHCSVVNACYAACVFVLGPVTARSDYGGARAWSLIVAAQSLGVVAGGFAAARLRPHRPLTAAVTATAVMASPFFALAVGAPLAITIVAAFAGGGALAVFGIYWQTTLQHEIEDAVLSRAVSFDTLASFALVPLALVAAGPLSIVVGPAVLLAIAGGSVLISVLVTLQVPAVRAVRWLSVSV
jgi:MFS family permease